MYRIESRVLRIRERRHAPELVTRPDRDRRQEDRQVILVEIRLRQEAALDEGSGVQPSEQGAECGHDEQRVPQWRGRCHGSDLAAAVLVAWHDLALGLPVLLADIVSSSEDLRLSIRTRHLCRGATPRVRTRQRARPPSMRSRPSVTARRQGPQSRMWRGAPQSRPRPWQTVPGPRHGR